MAENIPRNIVNKSIPFHITSKILSTLTNNQKVPDYFNWADSGLLRPPEDQGSCGCCWAISPLGVFADRISIQSKGDIQTNFDVIDLMQCTFSSLQPSVISLSTMGANDRDVSHSHGCCGGYPDATIHYLQENGIIDNGENETFKKWCLQSPCCNYSEGVDCCAEKDVAKMKFEDKCKDSQTDRWFVKRNSNRIIVNYGSNGDIDMDQTIMEIKKELMNNGPLLVCFFVFEDFLPQAGKYDGKMPYVHDKVSKLTEGHAVEVVGWKTVAGIPSWIFKNSWGTSWGINGYGYFAMTDRSGINAETNFQMPASVKGMNSGGMIAFDADDSRSIGFTRTTLFSTTQIMIGASLTFIVLLIVWIYIRKRHWKK